MNGLHLLLVAVSVATAYVVPNELCVENENCKRAIGSDDTLHLPNDSDIYKFFKCVAGKACPMECPKYDGNKQLVFNPEMQSCDWPLNLPNQPNSRQLSPLVLPAQCKKTDGRHRLQYEKDCKHYYEVINNVKVIKECKWGFFNCILETCDLETNVPWCA